jgi:hypothetical protein
MHRGPRQDKAVVVVGWAAVALEEEEGAGLASVVLGTTTFAFGVPAAGAAVVVGRAWSLSVEAKREDGSSRAR